MFTVFFIPLILSIGIIPAIPFSDAADYSQICIDKVWIESSKGRIACVIASTAEKLVERGWGTTLEEIPMEKELPLGVQKIETRSGTITIDHDYLTPESDQLLSDELFFQRAVQVYHMALPAVGGAGIFYEIDKIGATAGDILYWSDFMNSDIELLTGNTSVLYFMSLQDLSNGPIVLNVPAGNLQGHMDNIYQQQMVDYGIVGPNEGNEAFILVLPPNYDGEIPESFDINTSTETPNFEEIDGEISENHFVIQSDTMRFLFIGRAFVNSPDKAAGEELILNLNVFNLFEIDNPPKAKFIDVSGESLKLSHPTTEGFWEFLHEVYSKETVVRPEDRNLIGLMHAIGIVPGEPFEPDEHSKEILDKAAVVADLMARNIAYDSPVKEPFLYYPDKNWELAFMTKNPSFLDERGSTQIEPRMSFIYQGITTADAMVLNLVGKGSKYLMNYRDADENFLKGSNTYHLQIPADVPAANFWSLVAYDAETRSMLKNDVQPLPAIRSLDSDNLKTNEDGSIDVYIGPEAPEGLENNWIKTNEGDGFFVAFRFYSPTEAYYDMSWQLPMIEIVK